ncbi:YlxR family protein [Dehalococcoidia bacterium]|nr:YlxR family protein [Dehalococcoidia bacterium]MCL0088049.1 YlxR family protein [Dehalococcoidia bacterium]MCL0089298.1 YlxR family protein [Dehalococcoidia bacterium]MCL0093745.1 YlxR family protein [Dehalococcoidia bacterium]
MLSHSDSRGKGAFAKKHVPQRTCIACRQTKPKRELVRLVRSPNGELEIDHRGKKAGRGAYLCPARECWELTLGKDRRNRLARALRIGLTEEYRTALMEYGKTLPEALAGHRKESNDSEIIG